MKTKYSLSFPRINQYPLISGTIKSCVEDFYVEEILNADLQGEGEHVWLWLEKAGQNTEYVAGQIARFANVRKMDVGFSGLKDRWAVTRQWFSVYLGNKPEPDWSEFEVEGVQILSIHRHVKKLRRGEHESNKFRIVIRNTVLDNANESLDLALLQIQSQGFPNYYGPQRFGLHGANLDRGELFFEGKIKASKSQRSFYISAARSFLFNLNLAERVTSGDSLDSCEGGPLYGDETPGKNELNEKEKTILEAYPSFKAGIHKNRLKLERRPYVIVPQNMSWSLESDKVITEFTLPSGVFATSLLAELFDLTQGLGEGNDALKGVQ